MRSLALILAVQVIAVQSVTADDTPAARQYQSLLDEYEQEGGTRVFAKRFIDFARQHSQDPVAVDALSWVIQKVRGKADTTTALELLVEHHVGSDKLAPVCKGIASSRSLAAEKLLRVLIERSPHEEVRAHACYHLAKLLELEAGIVEQLAAEPELAPRVLQYYGKDYGKHLSSLKPAELERRREQVYQRLADSFPEVEIDGRTLGKIAQRALFQIRHLSIGKVAPEIEGEDIHGERFKLSDYRGNVVMLTFWGHW